MPDDTQRPRMVFHARSIVKSVAALIVVTAVFLFGVGVGNGHVVFGSTADGTHNLPANLDYSSVSQVYNLLKSDYDGSLDANKLLDGLKSGLTNATGDPYTEYFSASEAKEFNNQLNGSFSGIGAELGKNDAGNLIIVSPIDGSPASKAGLRPQDVIVSINGKTTEGMEIDQAVSLIRGAKGTNVTLNLLRNKTQTVNVTITRDDIKVPSVKWQMLDGNVGYIQVNQFGDDTSPLIDNAAQDLTGKGAKRILLDLRGNPGGLLTAAVHMASLWLQPGKTVLQEKRGSVVTETYKSEATTTPVFANLPTVVLLDGGSASAAEIVAGALHDNDVATIYGEKSFGKGSVQQIHQLPGGAEIKITVARWYRPNGQNIDKKGIVPDKEVPLTEDDINKQHDPQKDAALQYLLSK